MGKSTTVTLLSKKLRMLGYSVSEHFEGDSDSPLDLCWTAYLTKKEYDNILVLYPAFADKLSENIIYQGEYILLRYQVGRKGLYSPELNRELHKKEFCYNPTNNVPLSKFTEVFLSLWKRYVNSDEIKYDYAIFDASLSHITNDLMRNYNSSKDEITEHLEMLLETIRLLDPVIFYLSSENVSGRLKKARQSRKQTPLSNDQISFWKKRKNIDMSILPRLLLNSYIMDISNENWDLVISEIVLLLTT